MAEQQNKRLLSLDILRGITVAGMLLVNNPGSWSSIYAPLEHAEWIGLTPTDLVFPFFVFVMGVSMYFSLRKFQFRPSAPLFRKIVHRTIVLFLIGWAVQWFGYFLRGLYNPDLSWWQILTHNGFSHMRILGVFQRLALVYFFGSLLAVLIKHRFIPWIAAGILAVYALILAWGSGYDFSLSNIIAQIDNNLLGSSHMYHESVGDLSLAFDPEGILSTLPCIAHVLIGFMVGKIIIDYRDNMERIAKIAVLGFAMLLAGWLLSYGIPCGKKMWSATFVLITCGLASCLLSLLIYVIDVKGHSKWCAFFHAFGVNPLFCYLAGTVLAIAFGAVRLGTREAGGYITAHSLLHDLWKSLTTTPEAASCLFAISFVGICWLMGYLLYREKIFIKI